MSLHGIEARHRDDDGRSRRYREFRPRRGAVSREPRGIDPVGDHADPGESESGAWLRPASALEAARAGQMTLLPPTAVTLGELAGHADVPAILARRQVITPRLPKVVVEDGRVRLHLPPAGEEQA